MKHIKHFESYTNQLHNESLKSVMIGALMGLSSIVKAHPHFMNPYQGFHHDDYDFSTNYTKKEDIKLDSIRMDIINQIDSMKIDDPELNSISDDMVSRLSFRRVDELNMSSINEVALRLKNYCQKKNYNDLVEKIQLLMDNDFENDFIDVKSDSSNKQLLAIIDDLKRMKSDNNILTKEDIERVVGNLLCILYLCGGLYFFFREYKAMFSDIMRRAD